MQQGNQLIREAGMATKTRLNDTVPMGNKTNLRGKAHTVSNLIYQWKTHVVMTMDRSEKARITDKVVMLVTTYVTKLLPRETALVSIKKTDILRHGMTSDMVQIPLDKLREKVQRTVKKKFI